MREFIVQCLILMLSVTTVTGRDSDSVDLTLVSAKYEARLQDAASQLSITREAIMEERAPLVSGIDELEDRVIALRTRITKLEIVQANLETKQGNLNAQRESVARNLDYEVLLAGELAETLEATLLPGESAAIGDPLELLKSSLERPDALKRYDSSRELFNLALDRLKTQLGGTLADGLAVHGDSNELREGRFLYLGPVAYFRNDESGTAGLAYRKEGSSIPFTQPIPDWDPSVIGDVFKGKPGTFPADATGGKALQLMEARGTTMDHIRKGGPVGYVIIGLGVLALLTALTKLWDLKALAVDNFDKIRGHIHQLNHGDGPDSGEQFSGLKACSRELFDIGWKHRKKPKQLLEEILYAYVLLQRNLHEKRLPLLRVIAASAPLLGLLGTVIGMIKTFTLITVLGTGNAAKLSSGISEALVTTELGLIVAIPTLIIHGYLSHQTEKRLGLLEQASIEVINALQWSTGKSDSGKEGHPWPS